MRLKVCLLVLTTFPAIGAEASPFEKPLSAFVSPRSSPSSSKCHPRIAPSPINQSSENARQCNTALKMGLRSFLSKKVLKRKGDDDENDEALSLEDSKLPIPTDPEVQDDSAVNTSIPDPSPGKISYEDESVQERVKRLKSGRMTDAEKDRFLQTALSASNADIPANKKPALRQRVPSSSEKRINRNKESASPFPKDSIMKNTFSRSGTELDSDKKKREYLEMVTNPDRFKGYVTPTATEEPSSPIDSFISDDEEVTDTTEVAPSTSLPPPGSPGLASRLEAAASAEEKRKREMLKQQEANRQKQMQKMAEMQRIRNDEIAKREEETLQRKREIEAATQREVEERLRAEELRREEMQAAQDAYWASKLQEEREAQREMLAAEERKEKQKKKSEKQATEPREVEQEQLPSEPELAEAQKEVSGVQPDNGVGGVTFSSYLREQAVEKASIDASRDAQLESLRALNSPLPSPPKAPSPSPILQQQRNVPPSPPMGGRSIADFSKRTSVPLEPKPRAKSVSEVMAELDNDGDAVVDSDKGSGGMFGRLLGNNQKKQKSTPESSHQNALVRQPLNDLPVEKKAVRQKLPDPAPAKKKVVRQQLPDPAAEKKAVRQELPLGDDDFDNFSRNGPNKNVSIRDAMQKNGGLSDRGTADQSERSKKWGVDITRFQDD